MSTEPCPKDVQDSHEERIQKLEDGFHQVATQMAESAVKLEYVGKAVEDSANRIADKIEACITPLTEKLVNNTSEIKEIAAIVATHTPKLEAMDAREAERAERRAWFKKIGTGVVIGVVGILTKELTFGVFRLFHH